MRLLVTSHVSLGPDIAVEVSDDADDIVALARDYPFDAIVLDGQDVILLTVISKARLLGITLPIVTVVSCTLPVDLLNAGADAVLRHGWANREEVLATVKASIRRAAGCATSVIGNEHLSIDLNSRIVTCCGQHVALQGRELDVLEALLLRRGMGRWALIQTVWGSDASETDSALKVHITNIRNKLQSASNGLQFIETIHGYGYRLLNNPVPAKRISTHGQAPARGPNSLQRRILSLLERTGEPMTVDDMEARLTGGRSAIYRAVQTMASRDQLYRVGRSRPMQFFTVQSKV